MYKYKLTEKVQYKTNYEKKNVLQEWWYGW